jgi:integrase
MPRKKKKPFNRLPNGFGSIKKLSGNRRKPYAVYAPSKVINGVLVPGELIECVESWESGYERLVLYKANKEWEEKKKKESLYTFSEVYEMYYREKYELSLKKYSEQSKKSTRAAFNNCVYLHDKIFVEITYDDLQDNIDGYIGKLKHASLELIKNLYNGMYKCAIKKGICEKDIAKFVEIRIEDDDENGVPFTEDELRIIVHSDLFACKIATILCYSGWRITELLNVEIDRKNNLFFSGLKTAAGKDRIVPIHPFIIPLVEKMPDKMITSVNSYRRELYKALEKLGIEKHTPHDCRHTFSWLCDKYKVDKLSKKKMMGHAISNDVTDAVYGHRTIEQLRDEINKISCY